MAWKFSEAAAAGSAGGRRGGGAAARNGGRTLGLRHLRQNNYLAANRMPVDPVVQGGLSRRTKSFACGFPLPG